MLRGWTGFWVLDKQSTAFEVTRVHRERHSGVQQWALHVIGLMHTGAPPHRIICGTTVGRRATLKLGRGNEEGLLYLTGYI